MVQVEWRWPSGRRAYKRVPRCEVVSFMLGLSERGAKKVRTLP